MKKANVVLVLGVPLMSWRQIRNHIVWRTKNRIDVKVSLAVKTEIWVFCGEVIKELAG
jgi:hypothetical protein